MRVVSLLAAVAGMVSVAGATIAADVVEPVEVTEPLAAAAGGFYLSLHGGPLWTPDTEVVVLFGPVTFGTDAGYRIGGSLGFDFNSVFGIEGEVSYGSVSVGTADGMPIPGGTVDVLTVMGNLIVGPQMDMWRPYVGVGGGIASVNPNVDIGGNNGMNDTDTTWAAQAFLGVDFQISDTLSIGGRYRYQHIGSTDYLDFDFDPVSVDHISAHSIEAVLKVRFGE